MASRLDQIVAAARRRVSEQRNSLDLAALEQKAEQHKPRGFQRALDAAARSGPAIIAELKKASPSRGLIRADFDPVTLAVEMEHAGAAALSVLTDQEFFQGSLENLRRASDSTKLPCLRKDFIVDELQVVESRANQADAILLIVAALSDEELVLLSRRGWEAGLDVLCEVHDEHELERALEVGCDFIGVNSRDLRTFEVDLNTAIRLAAMLPKDAVAVAESGIHSGHDVARLWAEGYKAFLIGESLMRETSPGEGLKRLLADSRASVGG